MVGFCTTKCSRFLLSPCDYDLFAKVKEPLRVTRYNTRDELICAIGQTIRNINKDGCADGIRCLPNIWQKVIMKICGVKIQFYIMLHFYFFLKRCTTINICKLSSFKLMVWQRILEHSTSQEVTGASLSEEIWGKVSLY